jgi:hypothetical protein
VTCRKAMAKNLDWWEARGSGGLAIEAPRQPFRSTGRWALALARAGVEGEITPAHTQGAGVPLSGSPAKGTLVRSLFTEQMWMAVSVTAVHL